MLVICEGYKLCGEDCFHSSPHDHQDHDFEDDEDNYIASCSEICCDRLPYHCTHECYILSSRKDKLKKIQDVSNL